LGGTSAGVTPRYDLYDRVMTEQKLYAVVSPMRGDAFRTELQAEGLVAVEAVRYGHGYDTSFFEIVVADDKEASALSRAVERFRVQQDGKEFIEVSDDPEQLPRVMP
jgi:hypothetical protein